MKFWGAIECTIVDQLYFHLKTCCLMNEYKSISDQAVIGI